ncbi:hypothetical protein [Nocardioides jishulii]|uniref:Uncharacterized protein n=1 Tax=Nocardioides jishulii TaxID=2575440 RepID=A0A4U2YSB8_9ACTN|nr:hypothetical protein [Nocardioides jishulii]QCX28766.1 hypothetical protein FCL41_15455 [Nocardioides jishulii]TKI64338.1 hypothetical protein FC770_04115 [Nocardioides jishulii]
MRVIVMMLVGAMFLFVAGVVHGGLRNSADPELVLGFAYAIGGVGIMAMVAAGVTLGIRLARD